MQLQFSTGVNLIILSPLRPFLIFLLCFVLFCFVLFWQAHKLQVEVWLCTCYSWFIPLYIYVRVSSLLAPGCYAMRISQMQARSHGLPYAYHPISGCDYMTKHRLKFIFHPSFVQFWPFLGEKCWIIHAFLWSGLCVLLLVCTRFAHDARHGWYLRNQLTAWWSATHVNMKHNWLSWIIPLSLNQWKTLNMLILILNAVHCTWGYGFPYTCMQNLNKMD